MGIKSFIYNLRKNSIPRQKQKEEKIKKYVAQGLALGDGTMIASRIWIDIPELTSIGKNCIFADGINILNHDASPSLHFNKTRRGSVSIGDNCFIGHSTIILPGVKVGPNCIIGAGSVVTKDIPENSVAAGNPATIIMSLEDYRDKQSKKIIKSRDFSNDESGVSSFYVNNIRKRKGDFYFIEDE